MFIKKINCNHSLCFNMYPSLITKIVEKPTTLREFIESLGSNYLYAFDRKVVGVVVNNKKLWPSAMLKPGDKVVIYPIITGG